MSWSNPDKGEGAMETSLYVSNTEVEVAYMSDEVHGKLKSVDEKISSEIMIVQV